MKTVNILVFSMLFVLVAGISNAAGLNISDNSSFQENFSFTIGELNRTYTLIANVTLDNHTSPAANISVKFIMPYGIVPRNATGDINFTSTCTGAGNFSIHNDTHVLCEINYTHETQGNLTHAVEHRLYYLNVTANASAYPVYGNMNFNYTVACDNCSNTAANSTVKAFYGGPYFKNPRPSIVANQSDRNVTLRIMNWNQTDNGYQLMAPLETYNSTEGKTIMANNSFATLMWFDKSFFEFPAFMRSFSYNLTFKIITDGSLHNATFRIVSPINNTNLTNQSLFPLLLQTSEVLNFEDNTTRNFTIGTPNANDFTIYWNGSNYTKNTLNLTRGINISFNAGSAGNDQSIDMFTINMSTNDSILLAGNNDTEITMLLTLYRNTNDAGMAPPVFVTSQKQQGWNQRDAPAFGTTTTMSTIVNVTNVLWNYTLNNVSVSFMMPMNVTIMKDGVKIAYHDMTTDVNVTLWNGTDWRNASDAGISIVARESTANFTDSMPGSPMNGNTINLSITTWDIVLTGNETHLTLRNWTPTSDASVQPYALINFSAQISFPLMNESDVPLGDEGANKYNATVQLSQKAPINLTSKVTGLTDGVCGTTGSTCDLAVTVDGAAYTNFTVGSLVLNEVASGTHTVVVTYTLPTAAATTTTAATTSSGGTTPNPKDITSWSKLSPGKTTFKITGKDISVTEMELDVKSEITGSPRLTVEKLGAKPSAVDEPSGKVFQYLDITAEQISSDNLNKATIMFSVTRQWLTDNGFEKEDVVMMRYTDKWEELTTTVASEGASNVEFKAETPGFSTFALAARKVANIEPVPETTTTTTIPLFQDVRDVDDLPPPDYTMLAIAGLVLLILIIIAFRGNVGKKGSKILNMGAKKRKK
jgi:PGF-pre-PGF domain-containing protein